MVDVTTLPGSSMTSLNASLVVACAVVLILAPSSILSVGFLRHADPLAGLRFFFFKLDLVRRLSEACRSVHRFFFLFCSFLYAYRLKRAGLSIGFLFLAQLDLVRRSPEPCWSVRQASSFFVRAVPVSFDSTHFGSKFLA